MHIAPCTLKDANEFVFTYHRHHKPCTGQKFSISLRDEFGMIHGVAICGRPVARYLDDGYTLEINRCCTDGTRNACSMLYGACVRAAKAMGYKTVITYTLESEDGASLKASNFECDGIAGGKVWTGKRSGRDNGVPAEMKKRWTYRLGGDTDARRSLLPVQEEQTCRTAGGSSHLRRSQTETVNKIRPDGHTLRGMSPDSSTRSTSER